MSDSPAESSNIHIERPRCPYCHEEIVPGAGENRGCGVCLAWHHGRCWTEHGRCAACDHDHVSGPAEMSPSQPTSRRTNSEPHRVDNRRALTLIGFAAISLCLILRSCIDSHIAHTRSKEEARATAARKVRDAWLVRQKALAAEERLVWPASGDGFVLCANASTLGHYEPGSQRQGLRYEYEDTLRRFRLRWTGTNDGGWLPRLDRGTVVRIARECTKGGVLKTTCDCFVCYEYEHFRRLPESESHLRREGEWTSLILVHSPHGLVYVDRSQVRSRNEHLEAPNWQDGIPTWVDPPAATNR
jgi:hypothetical protein